MTSRKLTREQIATLRECLDPQARRIRFECWLAELRDKGFTEGDIQAEMARKEDELIASIPVEQSEGLVLQQAAEIMGRLGLEPEPVIGLESVAGLDVASTSFEVQSECTCDVIVEPRHASHFRPVGVRFLGLRGDFLSLILEQVSIMGAPQISGPMAMDAFMVPGGFCVPMEFGVFTVTPLCAPLRMTIENAGAYRASGMVQVFGRAANANDPRNYPGCR